MGEMRICKLGDIPFCYSFSGIENALSKMYDCNFKLCSLRDIVGLRIFHYMINPYEKYSLFDKGPILVRDAVLCSPGNPPTAKFIKNSPVLEPQVRFDYEKGIIIEPPRMADERNAVGKNGKEVYDSAIKELEKTNFFPNEKQILQSLEKSVEFPISEKDSFGKFIELKEMESNELIRYALGINVDMYVKLLEKSKRKGIRIYPEFSEVINGFEKPFVHQLVYGLDENGEICLHPTILFANRGFNIFGLK